jgi:hypothetical protein
MAPKKAPAISMVKVAAKLAALQIKADKVSAEIKILTDEVKKAAAIPPVKPVITAKKPTQKKSTAKKPAAKKSTASAASSVSK